MKKTISLSFLAALMISACVPHQNQEAINPDELPSPPPTRKEKTFLDSLKKEGYSEFKLDAPIMAYSCDGCASYRIEMTPPFLYHWSQRDSIRAVMRGMANNLYAKIIEDSVIVEFARIQITLQTETKEGVPKRIRYEYLKKELELANGFRVEKNNRDSPHRIPWAEKEYEQQRIADQIDEDRRLQRTIHRSDSFNKANGL